VLATELSGLLITFERKCTSEVATGINGLVGILRRWYSLGGPFGVVKQGIIAGTNARH
jgi:hypothetical protein